MLLSDLILPLQVSMEPIFFGFPIRITHITFGSGEVYRLECPVIFHPGIYTLTIETLGLARRISIHGEDGRLMLEREC